MHSSSFTLGDLTATLLIISVPIILSLTVFFLFKWFKKQEM